MVVGYRHGDPRFPFLWASAAQPPARWHDWGEGPVQYLADTPDGAWAEFLRHEEITDSDDLRGVRRRLWAVEFDDDIETVQDVALDPDPALRGTSSYPACQETARQERARGATCLRAPSAALRPGGARGQAVNGSLREAPERDGVVWVLVGPRPVARGWAAVDQGAPTQRVLGLVHHFAPAASVDVIDVRTTSGSAERRPQDRSGVDRRSTLDLTHVEGGGAERRSGAASDRRSPADRRRRS